MQSVTEQQWICLPITEIRKMYGLGCGRKQSNPSTMYKSTWFKLHHRVLRRNLSSPANKITRMRLSSPHLRRRSRGEHIVHRLSRNHPDAICRSWFLPIGNLHIPFHRSTDQGLACCRHTIPRVGFPQLHSQALCDWDVEDYSHLRLGYG